MSAPRTTGSRGNNLSNPAAARRRAAHQRAHLGCAVLGPLLVWLVKRGDSPEIDAQGKEALNFQIAMLIYNAVALVFCLILLGFVALGISGS